VYYFKMGMEKFSLDVSPWLVAVWFIDVCVCGRILLDNELTICHFIPSTGEKEGGSHRYTRDNVALP
jgi:hypothetical protein